MRAKRAVMVGTCGVMLAALCCNRDTRGDKVNEASVTSSGEATSSGSGEPSATLSEPLRASADLGAAEGVQIDGHAKFSSSPMACWS